MFINIKIFSVCYGQQTPIILAGLEIINFLKNLDKQKPLSQ